jgi:MraZ protein
MIVVRSGQKCKKVAKPADKQSKSRLSYTRPKSGPESAVTQQEKTTVFRGNHPTRVDEKGRLKLPAEFKRVVEEKYGTQFFITSRDGKIAEIYPMPEWEAYEHKLAAIPDMNPAKKKLMSRLVYYGASAEMDAQGRLLIPQLLREEAKTVGDVNVFGYQTVLKVSNQVEFRKDMDANPLTPEDIKALADLGL